MNIFGLLCIIIINKSQLAMKEYLDGDKFLVQQYEEIVKGSASDKHVQEQQCGFDSISGFDNESYEVRTYSNLNNVKF